MRIVYFKWNSFGTEDIHEAFIKLGHDIIVVPYSEDDVKISVELHKKLTDTIQNSKADVAFSSNFYPPISEACYKLAVPYISWVYDCPHVMLYSYTIIYDTNHIFVFDKEQYEEFAINGIRTVHYMPLAAAPSRLSKLINDKEKQGLFKNSRFFNRTYIAFIGAMYDEEHTFYRRLVNVSDYTRGYLEGIIQSQKQIWGYNFVRSLMNQEIMDDMSIDLPMQPERDSVVSREYLFGEYCINREITARERSEYISEIGKEFSTESQKALDLYTGNKLLEIPGVINHGPIDHYATAPFVYSKARININITLRSIHTGIPLRAFEILGAGGFLLSNYQADFADCYTDGEDYISFGSREDMLKKIDYYLSHEKERQEIASNGLRRTFIDHTYLNRIKSMLEFLKM